MNSVDNYETEILYRKETEINGEPWVIYKVTAVAYGHKAVCTLSYPKTEEPEVKVGFRFLA